MRVLVYPHDLNMGGSQTNAIEIAAKIRDLGVESIIFGKPGVLNGRIDELGLEFIESPNPGRRPSIKIASLLRSIAKERKIDVLHGYEWPPSLECVAAAYGLKNTFAVSTVMSMAVAPFIPKSMPLVVGTEQIAAAERQSGRRNVSVIEPPVDLDYNVAPPVDELAAFRRRWGLRHDATLVVCVSRLAHELKSEGLLSAIRAMGDQLADLDLQFLIVGDGPARHQISVAAGEANAKTQPDRVILTGEMLDPRAAYAVADIVLGMGGSALRALAFSKPLIVQGEQGYFDALTEETLPTFQWQGWYGVGSRTSAGADRLERHLRDLVSNSKRAADLATLGRSTVERRFSLVHAAMQQYGIYTSIAAKDSEKPAFSEFVRSGNSLVNHTTRRKVNRLRGGLATDDFNAEPVAATGQKEYGSATGAMVYLAGVQWTAVPGTDRKLASALATGRSIVWVDPPSSFIGRLRGTDCERKISVVEPGITRIHSIGPPGVTRLGLRAAARWWTHRTVVQYLEKSGTSIDTVLATSPEPLLRVWSREPVRRVYFATDDFVEGAELMGLSRRHLERSRESNIAAADLILAVTDVLAAKMRRGGGHRVEVFPNGCDEPSREKPSRSSPMIDLPHPIAGIVGQLNERLNFDILETVADSGISLALVGPRNFRDHRSVGRFDSITNRINVQWIDGRPADELPGVLSQLSVGLTPYSDTPFNRASFPLKSLEYLSAGLAVVSTDLPAARALDQRFVQVATTPIQFANAVKAEATRVPDDLMRIQRLDYASTFSWSNRASDLEQMLTR